MIVQKIQGWLIGGIVSVVITFFLFLIFLSTRYRKSQINQYVIHLRNGKVQSAGIGGSIFLLPLIDEYILIPTLMIQTPLITVAQVFSESFKLIKIKGELQWRVINPEKAFKSVSWRLKDENYVEKVLNSYFGTMLREICVDYNIREMIQNQLYISKNLKIGIKNFTADWGIEIKSLSIQRIKIMERELEDNIRIKN